MKPNCHGQRPVSLINQYPEASVTVHLTEDEASVLVDAALAAGHPFAEGLALDLRDVQELSP